VADTVEQALLLPKDMVDLRSLRRHEVFLSLKKDLAMVSPSISLSSFFILASFLPFLPFIASHFYFFLPRFFPQQTVQATFRAKEITNFCHWQMKEEEGRHNAAMEAFNVAEKRTNELKNKLTKVERDKKSVEAALDSVERQAEGQRVLLRQAED